MYFFISLRSLLICIGLCLPLFFLQAQDPYFKQYRVEEGLPSNEVYGMVFDDNNILWAITDRGVWRFDGYQSRHYTVSDGLKENTNFRIFKTQRNSILVTSMNNYLTEIVTDSVIQHPLSEQIHTTQQKRMFVQQLVVMPDGSMNLCYNYPGLYKFRRGSQPEILKEHLEANIDATVCIFVDSAGIYWDQINVTDTSQTIKTTYTKAGNRIYIKSGFKRFKNDYRKEIHRIHDNEFLFSFANKVFHFRNGDTVATRQFNKEVGDLFCGSKGDFWVGTLGDGVYRFPAGDLKANPIRYLEGQSITGVVQDHEENYWFSTSTNGIFQAVSLTISIYRPGTTDEEDRIVKAIASDSKNLYIGTQKGNVYKLSPDADTVFKLTPFPLLPSTRAVNKLFVTNENHLLIFKDAILESDLDGNPAGVRKIETFAYDYAPLRTGEWMVSQSGSLKVFSHGVLKRIWTKDKMNELLPGDTTAWPAVERIRALLLDSQQRLWLGSETAGLFSSKDRKPFRWSRVDTLLGRRIHDIVEAGNNMWISVADYGIFVIRPDSTILRISQKDGLSSDIVDVLYAESATEVWAGTNLGLNKITIDSTATRIVKIEKLTTAEGIPSNRIYQIIGHKGSIWIGTTQGAISIPNDYLKSIKIWPTLKIDSVIVNEIPRRVTNKVVFNPNENNLLFKFKAISYRVPHQIYYSHNLEGIDTDTLVDQNTEIRYPDLPSGTYTFRVKASYTTSFESGWTQSFTFTIDKHWYEITLFRICLVLVILGLLYLVLIAIIRSIKYREKEKQRLLEAEKRSLLSQMNPHFIFNSLNSIQHFMIQKDDFQANNYLTNFSSLIRRILDNSKKNLITLNEEVSTLRLYLEMEKLRFEEDFEYQIIRDPNIDFSEVMIPPMMIQPFAENAIWHGLMPLKTKGVLTITFRRIDGYYHCLIEDNGIGREKAAQIRGRREAHISTGMKNINERIALMNRISKKKIALTITDLKNADGSAAGTQVELAIPINWE